MVKLMKATLIILVIGIVFVAISETSVFGNRFPENTINYKVVTIEGNHSIIKQDQSQLIPVIYNGKVDFNSMPDFLKKEKFIDFILPPIVLEREVLLEKLQHIEFIELSLKNNKSVHAGEIEFLNNQMKEYNAVTISELKQKLYPPPVSLALAQAILESGWGTSKAYKNTNNIFGIMSFSANEPRVQIYNQPTKTNNYYLKVYDDVSECVNNYFTIMAKGNSYKEFRKQRWERAGTLELIKYLGSYHESDTYIKVIHSIVKNNNLEKYDNIFIDQQYIVKSTGSKGMLNFVKSAFSELQAYVDLKK